jgi:hypothetical protein
MVMTLETKAKWWNFDDTKVTCIGILLILLVCYLLFILIPCLHSLIFEQAKVRPLRLNHHHHRRQYGHGHCQVSLLSSYGDVILDEVTTDNKKFKSDVKEYEERKNRTSTSSPI